jgi:histidinol-phosphate/aromatic aminotransferase/cobyric acid decarboxylase-like protein
LDLNEYSEIPEEKAMTSLTEKGGGAFEGIKLLLCENPLPPIGEAIATAQAEVPRGNYYTEAYSAPLRRLLSEQIGVAERLIHINAGSELILRQLFDRFGQQVHLLTPTYSLFPEIASRYNDTRLLPERDFSFDLADLRIPDETTLVVIVNPKILLAAHSIWDRCPVCSTAILISLFSWTRHSSALPGNRLPTWYRNIKTCW